ncbi:MAG: hypothetical protein KBT03_13000 [Bacteroidales bacterium]|nr:hypothetical protein [Candidatus Scybalousia scybalohippi]
MAYSGQLNSNEIFNGIYNMIISQEVISPALASNYALVDKFKVDGGLYGDTKLFYDVDVLKSRPWMEDAEAANLLAINRPASPECQEIVMDQFRQIDITVDQYLTKRAWAQEGAFTTFNSVILTMVNKTKKLYEVTLFNSYVGTEDGKVVEVPVSEITATGEEKNRLEAQMIAQYVADTIDEMKDYSREYNDYGFMRAYDEGELMFIWNTKYLNKLTYVDLPTIFHSEVLKNKFSENKLPPRFFGTINTSAGTTSSTNTTIRSLVEKDYTVSGAKVHVFPGDLVPKSTAYLANETYTVDEDVVCKIITKDTYKIMSAFETATEFFNPRSLTTNHYLTWGYSNPDRLLGQPLVTVHAD